MNLKEKLQAIAASPRPSTKGRAAQLKQLKQLKHEAESLTKQHEEVNDKVDHAAHSYAKRKGFGPSTTDAEHHRNYEAFKDHYVQHYLQHEHPELHKQMHELQHRAPQARIAYKRALRNL